MSKKEKKEEENREGSGEREADGKQDTYIHRCAIR